MKTHTPVDSVKSQEHAQFQYSDSRNLASHRNIHETCLQSKTNMESATAVSGSSTSICCLKLRNKNGEKTVDEVMTERTQSAQLRDLSRFS